MNRGHVTGAESHLGGEGGDPGPGLTPGYVCAMSVETSERDPAPTAAVEGQAGRFTTLVATVWLLFLIEPLVRHWDDRGEDWVWLGYVSTLVFAATYVVIFELLRRRRAELELELPLRWSIGLLAVLVICWIGMLSVFGQDGSGAVIFITVSSVMVLSTTYAIWFVLLVCGAAFWVAVAQTGWERDLELPLLALIGGFVMWAVRQVMERNVELMRTRRENELLLLEQERNRFARDLHDILGHSLTVIAVKAELARRLVDVDNERALREIRDLERLSRDALTDVRRAVQGYREITLPGELARARGVLAAAGIEAALPSSADDVAGELRELFAWAIREAVTNIVRHSRARKAEIELSATTLRIANDGVRDGDDRAPGQRVEGSGLVGLRERVHALGGTLSVQRIGPEFIVEVSGS